MRRLREIIQEKRTKLWILHHDNASCHALMLVREFLAESKSVITPHWPHPPVLAPADFFLFPK